VLVEDLPTPSLLVDLDDVDHNIDVMSAARPGARLRPHVKAFKSTALARHVTDRGGHRSWCCATLREVEGMTAAGLGEDLLLANETLDADRLGRAAAGVAAADSTWAPLAVAVDSDATLAVAASARAHGPLDVFIDVDVGLPRCGCAPADAGRLADAARVSGLGVRGVMGYEGHVVGNPDRAWRAEQVRAAMELLRIAHDAVGGVSSAGGTGTYDLHDWADEVQAGSYLLMDTHYQRLELPFRLALWVEATVISANSPGAAVADAGLKAFGMDHGDPSVIGHRTFFCSDEHVTFFVDPDAPVQVGDHVRIRPAHVDPTVAYHERIWVARSGEVVDSWAVDLRGW